MEEKKIMVNGKKVKIITKLPKEYIEDNSLRILLDDTKDLTKAIREIKNDGQKQ